MGDQLLDTGFNRSFRLRLGAWNCLLRKRCCVES